MLKKLEIEEIEGLEHNNKDIIQFLDQKGLNEYVHLIDESIMSVSSSENKFERRYKRIEEHLGGKHILEINHSYIWGFELEEDNVEILICLSENNLEIKLDKNFNKVKLNVIIEQLKKILKK